MSPGRVCVTPSFLARAAHNAQRISLEKDAASNVALSLSAMAVGSVTCLMERASARMPSMGLAALVALLGCMARIVQFRATRWTRAVAMACAMRMECARACLVSVVTTVLDVLAVATVLTVRQNALHLLPAKIVENVTLKPRSACATTRSAAWIVGVVRLIIMEKRAVSCVFLRFLAWLVATAYLLANANVIRIITVMTVIVCY